MAEDPFYLVRQDVESSVSEFQHIVQKWSDVVRTSGDVKAIKKTRSEADTQEESLRNTMNYVVAAIERSKENMEKFRLSPEELSLRTRWLDEQQAAFRAASATLKDDELNSAANALLGSQKKRTPSKALAGDALYQRLEAEAERRNEEVLSEQKLVHKNIIQRQNEELDDLTTSVRRINRAADNIAAELEEQKTMLDRLSDSIAAASAKLADVTDRTDKLIRSMGCIGGVVIIFLLVLVIAGLICAIIWIPKP